MHEARDAKKIEAAKVSNEAMQRRAAAKAAREKAAQDRLDDAWDDVKAIEDAMQLPGTNLKDKGVYPEIQHEAFAIKMERDAHVQ